MSFFLISCVCLCDDDDANVVVVVVVVDTSWVVAKKVYEWVREI